MVARIRFGGRSRVLESAFFQAQATGLMRTHRQLQLGAGRFRRAVIESISMRIGAEWWKSLWFCQCRGPARRC